ncbi:MAG TPA: hypothetical protein VF824_22295 [Thermoanaerobaculia bacterium]
MIAYLIGFALIVSSRVMHWRAEKLILQRQRRFDRRGWARQKRYARRAFPFNVFRPRNVWSWSRPQWVVNDAAARWALRLDFWSDLLFMAGFAVIAWRLISRQAMSH